MRPFSTLIRMAKKARKGRPRKAAGEHFEVGFNVKVTRAQKKLLNAAAKRAGKPLAVWLRELALAAAEHRGS